MKHLTTLLTMAITFSGLAQQMPYNPDANGDDFVGVDDVLGVLGVYDTALMQPDLQCDYDGTEIETWFGDLFSANIVLDSVYVEYLIADTVSTFLPGCPDPVVIETVLSRGYVLNNVSYVHFNSEEPWIFAHGSYLNYTRKVHFKFNPDLGTYRHYIEDAEVGVLTNFEKYSFALAGGDDECCNNSGSDYCCNTEIVLPFNSSWTLDEDGIQVDWRPDDWVTSCSSFRLIPFWHEAE